MSSIILASSYAYPYPTLGFVVVGGNTSLTGGVILTSATGADWTAQTSGLAASAYIPNISKANGTFVTGFKNANGASNAKRSNTGTSWSATGTYASAATLEDLVWDSTNSRWVAIGSNGTNVRMYTNTATDASSAWSAASGPTLAVSTFKLAWNGTVFASINTTTSTSIAITSSALSGSASPSGMTNCRAYGGIAVDPNTGDFVVVGAANGEAATYGVTLGTVDSAGSAFTNHDMYIYQLAENGSVCVGVGGRNSNAAVGCIQRTTNGTDWYRVDNGTFGRLQDVVWNGTIFCAVGDAGGCYTSTDGLTWTQRSVNGTTNDLLAVSWNGTFFATTGTNGTVFTSTDGITWTTASTPNTNRNRIAWNGTTHCIAGEGTVNSVLTSTDCVNWTARTSAPLNTFTPGTALEGGNNIFCIGPFTVNSGNGVRATAADGSAWTTQAFGNASAQLRNICYSSTGGYWMALYASPNQSYLSASGSGTYSSTGGSGAVTTRIPQCYIRFGSVDIIWGPVAASATGIWGPSGACSFAYTTTPNGAYTSNSPALLGITWNATLGKFLVCGKNGYVGTFDRTTGLFRKPTPTTDNLWGIDGKDGKYVAAGNNGTIIYSSDLENWSLATSGTTAQLYDVQANV